MTKQRQGSAFFEVAEAVFCASDLQSGFQFVKPLDSAVQAALGVSTSSLGMSFYLLASQSLRSAAQELLVLLDRPLGENDEAFPLITKVARDVAGCTTATCVAEGIEQITDHAIGDIDLQLWGPKELFSRVLQLPRGFEAELRTLAGIQRPDEFPYAFQERMARVHVVSGRQPAEKFVELSSYFQAWLGARRRHSPILLLGERGSGKSWQMLRFALDAYRLHQEQPWTYGPAFLVRLRDLVDLVEHASSASPVICEYLFRHHPGLSAIFGGAATLGAMFGTGHAVVLVDGFDEMDVVPTDARVGARLTSLLLLLSKRTRFVLSSRGGHFSSLAALFAMPAWSDSTVAKIFEILEIIPFDETRKVAYINAASGENADSIRRIFGFGNKAASPLQRALSICASHPGLLAQMKDDVNEGVKNPLKLIEEAILAILVEYNLFHGRAQEDHHVANDELAAAYGLPQETWIKLSVARRAELLGDLAWYMAERRVDTVDLVNLPPRIRLEYRIADDALERDLRSQTVLELVADSHPVTASDVGTSSDPEQGSHRHTAGRQVAGSSVVRFTLRNPEGENESVGESSVTGAYFLAQHLVSRLLEPGPFGDLPPSARLKYLGRLPLGPLGAAMLSEMLRSAGASERRFGEEAWRLLHDLAKGGGYEVFSPSYRYLVSNLLQIGGLSRDEAQLLDPWQGEVSRIVRGPLREEMKGHEMALVPPPPMAGSASQSKPFLLGVHEVTNEEYRRFIASEPHPSDGDCTVRGLEWSVGRVTVAGSGDEGSRSENHRLTNEYHLFFWLPTGRSSSNRASASVNGGLATSFVPPTSIRDHPVTYVSWFAAAAFCDWLSLGDGFGRHYKPELFEALEWSGKASVSDDVKAGATGYRLPTRSEWVWAAKGGHEDLQRPWEAFPYYLAERGAGDRSQRPPGVVDDAAWTRYARYQQVMKAVLLGAGKQAREVLYDEPNDYGVSGLVGNVREWVQDTADGEGVETERLILGATGFLGEQTFDFEYKTSLYPRNTNPDVGFRVARSLRPSDVEVLRQREIQIASLMAKPQAALGVRASSGNTE